MSNFTRVLSEIEQGDPEAAERLLPLVYDDQPRLRVQQGYRNHLGLWSTHMGHYMRLAGVVLLVGTLSKAAMGDDTTSVKVISDVPYLGEGRHEKLDIYLPSDDDEIRRRPAVIIIHGGGWHSGDKAARREQNIATTLAGAGYVCASINYDLAEKKELVFTRHLESVWPQNLHDCKTAVRFLRKHADRYRINPERIGAIGGSAGGHLAAMLALTDSDDGLDPEGPYGEFSCAVQAFVPMYGNYDQVQRARAEGIFEEMSDQEQELCRQASPVNYVSRNDPPALILHGTHDALVPVQQSRILLRELAEAKIPAKLEIVEGAAHSFHLQPQQRDLRGLVIEFFDRHLASD